MSACTCAVCYEDIVVTKTGRAEMSCGHAYHIKCIADWMNTGANTCPMCRKVASDLEKPTKTAASNPFLLGQLLETAILHREPNTIPLNNRIQAVRNRVEINNVMLANENY
jgi:hypothetical protein